MSADPSPSAPLDRPAGTLGSHDIEVREAAAILPRGVGRSAIARCRRALDGDRRWVTVAIVVGFLVRLTWVVAVTGTPQIDVADPAQYQRLANQLADFEQPTIGGVPSAFHALGYPLLLTPVVWLHDLTGISVDFAAALLNVAAGTATIAWTARLARRSIGGHSPVLAAWLLALWPAHVVMASASLADVTLTALGVGATLAAVEAWRDRAPSVGRMLLVGAAIGATVLIRGSAIVLLVLPLVLSERRWRALARSFLVTTAGCLVVMAPVVIRTSVSVGVFAPLGTGGASSLCMAHRDGATGFPTFDRATLEECFTGSAWDNPDMYGSNVPDYVLIPTGQRTQDEARWYRTRTRAGLEWALDHPKREAYLSYIKTKHILTATEGSLDGARDSGARITVDPDDRRRWVKLAGTWQYLVLISAVVGLLVERHARRAAHLWLIPVLLLAATWGGVGLDRYQVQFMPFVTVLAAGGLAALPRLRRRLPLRPRTRTA